MSRCDDRWLDICTLLRVIEDDGEIIITPANNTGNLKTLSFTAAKPKVSGDAAGTILEVLNLADSFDFSADGGRFMVTVYVNVFS